MITLVTGGARSGKSSFAESLYQDQQDVVYIATARIEDEEMKQRVHLHQTSRPSCWRTYEGTYDLEKSLGSEKYYLLDCITILTSNVLFDLTKDMEIIDEQTQNIVEEKVCDIIGSLIKQIRDRSLDLVIVTNEVGASLVPENHLGRVYRDIVGRINQYAAKNADQVYALICGIPVKIK